MAGITNDNRKHIFSHEESSEKHNGCNRNSIQFPGITLSNVNCVFKCLSSSFDIILAKKQGLLSRRDPLMVISLTQRMAVLLCCIPG